MKTETYTLEIITPCFCAGADPAKAEIRAPSIRGQLRWWFRVLGGSRDQEKLLFGGVHGEEGLASALSLRILEFKNNPPWQPLNLPPNSNLQYLLYYAKASQNHKRWNANGAFAAGCKFKLEATLRRSLEPELESLWQKTLKSFLLLGSIGLRSTRGLGCFSCLEFPASKENLQMVEKGLRESGFLLGYSKWNGPEKGLLEALGAQLRGLRKGWPASKGRNSNPTPLGSSSPRQTSAVYLRPVEIGQGQFKICVFEAPEFVLHPNCRRNGRRLAEGVPESQNPPMGRNFRGRR